MAGITTNFPTLGQGQVYLEYIMQTIAAWASSTSFSADKALEAATDNINETMFGRNVPGLEAHLPDIGTIKVHIPKEIKPADLRKDFESEFERMTTNLVRDGVQFLQGFFPAIEPLEAVVCEKLKAMLNGEIITDQQAVWDRAMTSMQQESSAHTGLTDALVNMNTVAVPTGATQELITAGQQTQAILKREQIKARISIMLANLDFALTQVSEWRQVAITAMTDLISTYVSAAQAAASAAQQLSISQQPDLISAVAQYRNALLSYEQLKSEARQTYNQQAVTRSTAVVQAVDTLRQLNQTTLQEQAKSYAQQVSATLNGINAQGSVTHMVR